MRKISREEHEMIFNLFIYEFGKNDYMSRLECELKMLICLKIKLVEFAMSIYENSDTRWNKKDYENYSKLEEKLRNLKRSR